MEQETRSPAGTVLLFLYRCSGFALLALAVPFLTLLPPLRFLIPPIGYLYIVYLFLAGFLGWWTLALAVALSAAGPFRAWRAWDRFTGLLALVASTLFSTGAPWLWGAGRLAIFAAAFFVAEALLVLALRRGSAEALVQLAVVGLAVVGIPLLVDGQNPKLLAAYSNGPDHLTERVLLAAGALRSDSKGSAFEAAFNIGEMESLRLLLEHGANPNRPIGRELPLVTAVVERSPALVELLLTHGADPNLYDEYRNTALQKALRAGRKDNAILLLTHGANPNERYDWGQTALQQAVVGDRLDDVRLLLAHGADPNLHDQFGATALSLASPKVAEVLLAAKADPNHKDAQGRTAFFGGIVAGDPETLRLLVARGADVQARDVQGRTVLLELLQSPGGRPWGYLVRWQHFAVRQRDFSVGGRDYRVAEWLLGLGVPLDVAGNDKLGQSVLDVAARRGLLQVHALLEGHPCPPALGGPEREPWKDHGAAWRAALLVREPTLENRYALYRALRSVGTLVNLPKVRGAGGSSLLVVYGGQLPPGSETAGFRAMSYAQLLQIAADSGSGLLVASGTAAGAPAAEVPPGDIALIRRCVG